MIKRVGLELIDRGIVLNARTKVEMKTFNTGEATKDSRQERVISSKFVEEWQAAEERAMSEMDTNLGDKGNLVFLFIQ